MGTTLGLGLGIGFGGQRSMKWNVTPATPTITINSNTSLTVNNVITGLGKTVTAVEYWGSTDNVTFTKLTKAGATTSYENTGLENNSLHYYKVRYFSGLYVSNFSAVVSATTFILSNQIYQWDDLSTSPVEILFDNKIKFSSDQYSDGVFLDTGGYSRNATPVLEPSFGTDSSGTVNGALVTDATHFVTVGTTEWITTQSFCMRIKYYHDNLDSDKYLFSTYSGTNYMRMRALTTGLIDFQCKVSGTNYIYLSCTNIAANKIVAGTWNDIVVVVDRENSNGQIYLNGAKLRMSFNVVTSNDVSFAGEVYHLMCYEYTHTGSTGKLEKFEIYDGVISATAVYNIYLGLDDNRYFNNTGGKLQVTDSDYATAQANQYLDCFDKGIYSDIRDYQYTFDEFYSFLKTSNKVFAEPIKDNKIQLSGYRRICVFGEALSVQNQNICNNALGVYKTWGIYRDDDNLKIVGQYDDNYNLLIFFGTSDFAFQLNDTKVIWRTALIPKMENDSLSPNRINMSAYNITGSKLLNLYQEFVGPSAVTDGVNSAWVGGHHGNDITGYASSKTVAVSYKLDGVEIGDGESIEGNILEIDTYQEIQNPFSQTGDYIGVVRMTEHVNYKFIGTNINITTEWQGISHETDPELTFHRFYGIQHDHDYYGSSMPPAVGQDTKIYFANGQDVSIQELLYINPEEAVTLNSGQFNLYADADKAIISNAELTIQDSLWMDRTYGALKTDDRLDWIDGTVPQMFVHPRDDGWKSYIFSILIDDVAVNDDLYYTVKGGINIFPQLKDSNGDALNAQWAYIQKENGATYLCVDYLDSASDDIKIPNDIYVASATISECAAGTITVNSINENVISLTASGYGSAKILLT